MDSASSWDGTLRLSEFYFAARALSQKWKHMNHVLPPWTWFPCPRPSWAASHEVEGYLSLENVCYLRSNGEDPDRSCTSKEEPSYYKEELTDDATLSCDEEVHFYDFHILYSGSYKVPVLYFRAYYSDGQPLALDDIEKDLPPNSLKILRESKWTFITQEEHPYLNRPWYTLHPCGTSEWVKLLFSGDSCNNEYVIEKYLISWLSVVGQVVGLKIPLEMLKKAQLYPVSSSSSVNDGLSRWNPQEDC
ncbi:PREDICTED: ubiquitin-like-conjugating enzyme ATG10 isoform X2 [Nelumbo nucifera]|uniref:Ubiquitin-like-conjugating enzyme ATG10 n=2 Tax=Nelumbo nucifera TaxID=4432 RepID=A0A822ZIY1_NELNU|nr:PREDICTED: ubiquitin-like-conjugating enzyme ATG10 isoform X2 [Nelumbo nucifera]DAD43329.1 TPA_asm: hypothetical protein HUJ06_001559 [Nelumbo nucifera]